MAHRQPRRAPSESEETSRSAGKTESVTQPMEGNVVMPDGPTQEPEPVNDPSPGPTNPPEPDQGESPGG